jgi:DNA gyrase subunit A
MFFTNKGKMYRTIVDNIPDGTNITKGTPINTLIKLDINERVIAVTSLHRKTTPKFVIFITKEGMIKKTFLEEYLGAKKNAGIQAIKLREGDAAASILFQDEEDLIIITKKGMSIRFATKDIGAIGRLAIGVKAINLNEGDEVVAALPVHKDTDTVGIFMSNGLGKKVALKDFQVQGRGGKGSFVYKSQADEYIVGAAMLDEEDNVLLTGVNSSICISATEIPLLGKVALGNILFKNKNSRVLSITKI